jgi:Flp pilus assembly pilin Flp
MTRIHAVLKRFFTGTEGASAGEYAVALMLIAIVCLAAVTFLGNAISNFFASASNTI